MVDVLPRIEDLKAKKLIGKRLEMSFANNRTGELWKSFMPFRRLITNSVSSDLISMQVYSSTHFLNFDPNDAFEKWAAVEVSDLDTVPEGMEPFALAGGLYAVFHYKGSNTDPQIFQYIFGTWLPKSDYVLDSRPHFEVLGEKYRNNDPESEEEIWIPIKKKGA